MKLTRPIRYTNNNETRGIQFWPLVYILMKFGNSQKFPSNLSFCKADLNCLLCLFDASPMKLNFKNLLIHCLVTTNVINDWTNFQTNSCMFEIQTFIIYHRNNYVQSMSTFAALRIVNMF